MENKSNSSNTVEICIIYFGGILLLYAFFNSLWVEFKIDFTKHWLAYSASVIASISLTIGAYIWLYRQLYYQPKCDYSKTNFGKYSIDYRTPVELMADTMREYEAKNKKKLVKKNFIEELENTPKEKPVLDPFKDYDKDDDEIKIQLDFEKNVYKYYSINKHERKALIQEDYEILRYRTMLSNKFEKFLVRPRFNESVLHFFTIYDIQTFLEARHIRAQVFMTKKPDLVFKIKNKTYAIEVELGSVLKRSKQQVIEKHKTMKRDYNYGFIVVPIRRKIIEYRKVVPVVDMRYLKNKLKKILKKNGY